MKITSTINILAWSCIVAGLALFFITEDKSKDATELQSKINNEKLCLKESLYFEARNTSRLEQEAIAEVILNRVKHRDYPDTICKVVQQPYQFSYYNSVINKGQRILPEFQDISSKLDQKAYLQIEEVVDIIYSRNENRILPENTLFYHTKGIKNKPAWAKSRNRVRITLDKQMKHVYYLATR